MSAEPIRFDVNATGPLAGVRVVDLSRLVAGNMLSLQLADFGADVIKVEPPQGDPLREWKEDGHSLFWSVYGRNKRSIALNLREAGDMATLRLEHDFSAALKLSNHGVDVALPERSHANWIELALDADDAYIVELRTKAGEVVAKLSFGAAGPGPALAKRGKSIPTSAAREGCEVVRVIPWRGNGDYKLGHVRLLGACAERLAPGGLILFSNNNRRFKIDADALAGLDVVDISKRTIPFDFARNERIHHCFEIRRRAMP